MNETSVDKDKVKANVVGGETVRTTATSSKGKSVNDNKDKTRVIRNFTYELHDVENVFTSKMSFFLEELNKQLNALINSNIYTENKENLDKVIKSKGDFRKELLRLLKSKKYKDFYQKYYFEAEIFGNKAKYFRTVIEEYRRILLSRLHRQTIIDMIVNNPNITYQEVFNKLYELNERSQNSDYKFNWISKAEFNNIIKQVSNSTRENAEQSEAEKPTIEAIDIYAIDYSIEDDQISEFNLTNNDEYYLIEFKLKYSDYTTKSDSLLTYQCQVPKKQIKGLTTGYTKLKKFTRPRIFLKDNKLYISFNYELEVVRPDNEQAIATDGTWQFKTMGIDIGVAKSATAAIITTNMCWQSAENQATAKLGESKSVEASNGDKQAEPEQIAAIDFTQPVIISNELTISDKTQSVSKHIEILKNEQNHIYQKEKAIYDLLKLKQFDDIFAAAAKFNDVASLDLLYKYQRLNKLRLHLRHKISNLKK